jgi:hypothetical protein
MPDLPPLTAVVDWTAGTATVTVRGELDTSARSRLRERLAWVMESRPRRLVLDFREVTDRAGGQAAAVAAAVRRQLPPGCVLEVRPPIPAVPHSVSAAGHAGTGPPRHSRAAGQAPGRTPKSTQ